MRFFSNLIDVFFLHPLERIDPPGAMGDIRFDFFEGFLRHACFSPYNFAPGSLAKVFSADFVKPVVDKLLRLEIRLLFQNGKFKFGALVESLRLRPGI